MAEQVGVQSGARIGIHNHLNISQGGILNLSGFRRPYRTGVLALSVNNDAEKLEATGAILPAYALMKEIRINTAQVGQYRIAWEMRNDLNVINMYTQLWVNGVAVGASSASGSSVYLPYTRNYDVNLAAGDLIQLYGSRNAVGDWCYVQLFRIYYDWHIEYFNDNILNTSLPLSNADLLDVTNTVV